MTDPLRYPTPCQEWTPQKPCVQLAPPQDRIVQTKVEEGTWPQLSIQILPLPQSFGIQMEITSQFGSVLSAGTTRCLPSSLQVYLEAEDGE